MTCKICSIPTPLGWDNKPLDICALCSQKKAQAWGEDEYGEPTKPESKDGTEFYTHICKSCFSPSYEQPEKILAFFTRILTCRKCGRPALIPVDTPKGTELMKRIGYIES